MPRQQHAVVRQTEYFKAKLLLEQAQPVLAQGLANQPCMQAISGKDQFAYPEGHGIR